MLSVIEKLVKEIPEQYQQIFDHPQFDLLSARDCKPRLSLFNKIYDLLKNHYKRNIRVLDLGCAQGYFSLNLATKGAIVTGIDNCQENINLCIELAKSNNSLTTKFLKENIQDFIYSQDLDDFDLVIGLSVLHHISLHFVTLCYITVRYSTVQYMTVQCIILYYITVHYITE